MKLTFLLLFIVYFSVSGQNSGYMGKRFSLEATALIAPSFFANNVFNSYPDFLQVTQASDENQLPSFSLNIQPKISIEYAFDRVSTVGVSFFAMNHLFVYQPHRIKLSEELAFDFSTLPDPLNFVGNDGIEELFVPNSNRYEVNVYGANFFLRFYNDGFIAPIGIFHEIRFGSLISQMNSNADVEGTSYYTQNSSQISTRTSTRSVSTNHFWQFGYSFGGKKVLKNGFYLKGSVDFNYIYGSYRYKKSDQDKRVDWFNEKYLGERQTRYLRRLNAFQYNVGVGLVF